MKRMVLTRLVLSGNGKPNAVLEFKKGLNIISGDSDTGKTYAFQCLDYVFGAQKELKNITEADGYNLISLEFTVDGDFYRLERAIGSNKVDVTHQGETKNLNCKHDPVSKGNLSRYLLTSLDKGIQPIVKCDE